MKPANDQSLAALPSDSLVPLESILRTEELHRRPARPPDYETENRALAALVQALADSPRTILQTLADTILKILQAGSAGMSLLTKDGKRFYWAAIAGAWRPHLGGGTPREFGPCGDVLDCNVPLLFTHWERRYPYLLAATPAAEEGLLIPLYVEGKAVGTIWAIAHDDRRKFDGEDLRQLESLGRFASAAYQAVAFLDASEHRGEVLRQSRTELDRIQDSRRAALNLMEDAVQSRQAMETLNMKLRESERRFREMVDALPAAIYTTDADGCLTHFNPAAAELSGRTPELGTDQWCISWKLYRLDGTPLPHEECPMAIAIKEGRAVHGEQIIVERPDGTRRCLEPYPTLLRDAEGRVIGGINMLVDITERKQAEEDISRLLAETRQRERELREKQDQLVQAGKLASIGELATGVAHELNNPLNNIGLVAGNLIDQLTAHEIDETRVSADLQKILMQVSRAAKIIAQVRTFGRAAGADYQRLAIHEAIQAALDLVQEQFRLQNIEITLDLDPSNPVVLGNRLQLEQVFLNLLTNARDAMKNAREKSLSISTAVRAETVHVRFADIGMGIPADVLPRIFDPFFTTKEVGQGTGLGLSIGYSIIKEHQGTITADSRPGTGTTLVIELPLARNEDEDHESRGR